MSTYYISFTDGDDTRTNVQAQVQATPWKHHPDSNNATGNSAAQVLAAGDIVSMKCGDTWYDSILTAGEAGAVGNVITTNSYGTGAKPLIVAGVLLSSGWADGDADGEYTQALTTQPFVVVHGTTVLTEGTAGSLTVGQWDWVANVIYIRLTGDVNPNGQTIKVASRNGCIVTAQSYRTYQNLECQLANGASSGMGYGSAGTGTVFIGCTFKWPRAYGVRFHNVTTPTVTGCTIQDAPPMANDYGVYCSGTTTGAVISSNTITGFAAGIVTINGATTVTGNAISGAGTYGIQISTGAHSSVVNANTVSDCAVAGVYVTAANNVQVYDNLISDVWNDLLYGGGGAGTGIAIATSAGNTSIFHNWVSLCYVGIHCTSTSTSAQAIWGNVILKCKVNGIHLSDQNAAAATWLVYHNTVVHWPVLGADGNYHGHGLSVQETCINADFRNNIVYVPPLVADPTGGGDKSVDFIYFIDTVGQSITCDYNLYWADTTAHGRWKLGATNYATLALWQAAITADTDITGEDAHAVNSDPLFAGAATDDYSLLLGSPCINVGVNLGAAYDDGLDPTSTWPSAVVTADQNDYDSWEIGAYVYTTLIETTPSSSTAVRDLTSQVTVLTYRNTGTEVLVLQGVVKLGDGTDDLDGTGGEFEFTLMFDSQTNMPDPQLITFSTATRASVFTEQFPLPPGETVTFKIKSPNAADTSVWTRASVYEVGVESLRTDILAIVNQQRNTKQIYDNSSGGGNGVYPVTTGSGSGVYVSRC